MIPQNLINAIKAQIKRLTHLEEFAIDEYQFLNGEGRRSSPQYFLERLFIYVRKLEWVKTVLFKVYKKIIQVQEKIIFDDEIWTDRHEVEDLFKLVLETMEAGFKVLEDLDTFEAGPTCIVQHAGAILNEITEFEVTLAIIISGCKIQIKRFVPKLHTYLHQLQDDAL